MTTPGDRIRAFCAQQGLTQAERDYLLGVLGEAVTVEREACALLLELLVVEKRGDLRHAEANALEEAARMIRARGGS